MRTRATIAAVTSALALAGLVTPAAVADDAPRRDSSRPVLEKFQQSEKPAARSSKAVAPVISNVVVNGGKPFVVGIADKPIRAVFNVKSPGGIGDASSEIWHGTTYNENTPYIPMDGVKGCVGTWVNCTADFLVMPSIDLSNARAGKWNIGVTVIDAAGVSYAVNEKAGSVTILRESRLTTDATPEGVKKGKPLTVNGSLRIVNWNAQNFGAYANHTVHLEFMKKGAKAYSRVKTLKTDKSGNVKTTVTASADGYWRYVYPGVASVIAPKTSVADFIDVR
ncbi:calcium-binding protein [Streptomyces sp. NPDC094448]|uniref:calcium-binding protein n=1 Tax=Streptomyces sp. NPDC094448 TaxID=3366063 RepID=UPI00380ADE07